MSSATMTEMGHYLSFTLDRELFAIDIVKVREVLDYTKITKIPRMPGFVLGVINLRGSVVPVVDMRMKFGMSAGERTVNTCIVIVEVNLLGEFLVLGILVDSVQEVFELEQEQIEPPPKIVAKLDTDFIKGIGKKDEDFVIILDTNRIFSTEEITIVQGSDVIDINQIKTN